MSDPYIGEIRILPYSFAPRNWASCDGQILPISQNTALFSIIGITYGGDGRSTMALPNLQGRAPVHDGQGTGLSRRRLGERFGTASVSLNQATMPAHNHQISVAGADADETNPGGHRLAKATVEVRGFGSPQNMYGDASAANGQLASQALGSAGQGQAHENQQPFLGIQFCICLEGIFPPRE